MVKKQGFSYGVEFSLFVGAIVMGLTATPSGASESSAEWAARYYTLASVEVVEAPDSLDPPPNAEARSSVLPQDVDRDGRPSKRSFAGGTAGAAASPGDGGVVAAVQGIINVGLQIWKVVQDGAPVLTVQTPSATAIPAGAKWDEMSGWSAPAARGYSVVYKNLYGARVVDFTYRIVYTTGGEFRGRGQYISNISTVVDNVDVAWGYKFDATAEVPAVTNIGTTTAPVASAEVLLHWMVKNPFRVNYVTRQYAVTGKGDFQDLSRDPLP